MSGGRITLVLMAILLCGFVLRAGYSLSRVEDERSLESLPDQREYLQCAREYSAGRQMRYFDPRFGQQVYAARTPGYPYFLSLCCNSVRAARLAQAAVDVSTALAIFLLARRLGLGAWALLAAAGVCFNPLLIYFTSLLLTETLYTAMLAWGTLLVWPPKSGGAGLLGRQEPQVRWWCGTLILAAGVLVRPSAWPMAIAIPAAAFWLRDGRWGQRLLSVLAATAVLLLVLWPWAARNHTVLGQRIWLSTNSGITLYDGVHPAATGASDQAFVRSLPQLAMMNEVERDTFFLQQSRKAICESPGRIVRLAGVKVARLWSPLPLSDSFGKPLYIALALAWSLPLFALALVSAVGSFCNRGGALPRVALALLLLPMLLFTLMHAISVGSLRYRMPVEPLLALLAAAALAGWWARRCRK